ncbi:HEAT repeat domain-containing protein [Actinoplanes couchii]|uniref:PBS lyase HEAT domain protein repeat-containing protein n=1 Tax=Actinoplanes couchii TaxID=403638 RepID=A0ABQ3XN46_9ACTN|nr:HEAT repeat domain-containing protein [Actinoplanes couchii]MDR6318148.1 HEAT repeat protein [Actinoplanes couchii]GID59936.1 hypothetical protein Aco03nite_083400 [Actinoplanes couchii]
MTFDEVLRDDAAGDEDRRWELIAELHVHGEPEDLDRAGRLSVDPVAARRALAADVVGQLGVGGPLGADSLDLLLVMARDESDPGVISSIASGFGHIGDGRSLAPLIGWHTHPDAGVRYSVVFGLLRQPLPAAFDALVALSGDPDARVRDWATFGLARNTDEDFPQLRDALAARLDDEDVNTRVEAVYGLAVRGDERAERPLRELLESPPDSADVGLLATIRQEP